MQKTGMDAVKEKVPSLAALSRELNITRGAVAQWEQVPFRHVYRVAQITGLRVEDVRPDMIPEAKA